jgi:uncharacterized protein DUF2188
MTPGAGRGTLEETTASGVGAMSAHLIHVRCNDVGVWSVQADDLDAPLSQHTTETDAERAAVERAAAFNDASVLIHDRYSRVHFVHTAKRRSLRSGVSAGAVRRNH